MEAWIFESKKHLASVILLQIVSHDLFLSVSPFFSFCLIFSSSVTKTSIWPCDNLSIIYTQIVQIVKIQSYFQLVQKALFSAILYIQYLIISDVICVKIKRLDKQFTLACLYDRLNLTTASSLSLRYRSHFIIPLDIGYFFSP